MNEYERKLKSNVITKKNMFDIIMKQLNLITTYIIRLVTNEEFKMLTLKRKDAIIEEAYNLHTNLS